MSQPRPGQLAQLLKHCRLAFELGEGHKHTAIFYFNRNHKQDALRLQGFLDDMYLRNTRPGGVLSITDVASEKVFHSASLTISDCTRDLRDAFRTDLNTAKRIAEKAGKPIPWHDTAPAPEQLVDILMHTVDTHATGGGFARGGSPDTHRPHSRKGTHHGHPRT